MSFNSKIKQCLSLVSLSFLLSSGANAAVTYVQDSNGQYTGINNVEVSGAFYDVSFLDGTFDQLFSKGLPSFHDSRGESQSFHNELRTLLSMQTDIKSDPSLLFGCSDASLCLTNIPFEQTFSNSVFSLQFENTFNDPLFGEKITTIEKSYDLTSEPTQNWAVFTPVSPVPEAPNLALLAVGAVILTGLNKKKLFS